MQEPAPPIFIHKQETWPMWKIYSVPCDSAFNRFHCTILPRTAVSKWLLVEVFRSVGCELVATFVHGVCCVARIKRDNVSRPLRPLISNCLHICGPIHLSATHKSCCICTQSSEEVIHSHFHTSEF
jgi:hypothetical protein